MRRRPPPVVTLLAPTPTTPRVGDTVTFTASPQNFAGTVTYQWDFGDTPTDGGSGGTGGGGSPGGPGNATSAFAAGPNPNTHVYAATGTYTVTVQATGSGVTKSSSTSVIIAAAGPPSTLYTISGASLGGGGRFDAPLGQAVTFTSLETHANSWTWDFGDGTTAPGQTVTHTFTTLAFPNVVLSITGDGTNTIGDSSVAIGFAITDPAVLLLGENGRYQVRATWSSASQGTNGIGTAVTLTSDTGYFWFFSPSNLEVVMKVLDACSFDGHVWVFAGGLTNLNVNITVLDSATGATRTYNNPEVAFLPIQDTTFEACPAASSGAQVNPAATTAPGLTLSTPTPSNPIVGDSVVFQATATGFTGTVAYTWNFGDCPPITPNCGATPGAADGSNTHVYRAAATYTVTVTATSGSQTASATQSVTVSDAGATPHPSTAFTISGATLGGSNKWQAPVNQVVTFTASETHAKSWSWDFGNGDVQEGATVMHTFTAAGNPLVTLTVTGDDTNTSGTSSVTIRFAISDPYTLYVDGGRFAITADWSTAGNGGSAGFGTATSLTDDTGYFWFFSPSNTEVVVKVLDACQVDRHFWVFASGLTNLGVALTVTDTTTGTTMTYNNKDGSPFQPIQDFQSFVACQ